MKAHFLFICFSSSYGAPLTIPKTLPVETYAPATPKIVESYAPASQDAYGSASYAPETIPRTLTPVLSEAGMIVKLFI